MENNNDLIDNLEKFLEEPEIEIKGSEHPSENIKNLIENSKTDSKMQSNKNNSSNKQNQALKKLEKLEKENRKLKQEFKELKLIFEDLKSNLNVVVDEGLPEDIYNGLWFMCKAYNSQYRNKSDTRLAQLQLIMNYFHIDLSKNPVDKLKIKEDEK